MSRDRFALAAAAFLAACVLVLPTQSSRAALVYNLAQIERTVAMYTETGGDLGSMNLTTGAWVEAEVDGPYAADQTSDLATTSITGSGGWSFGPNDFPFLLESTLDATFEVDGPSTYTLASSGDVQLLDVTNSTTLGAAGAMSPGIEYRLIATAWVGTPDELYFSGPGVSDAQSWFVDLQVIPAPAGAALFGCAGLVCLRRRR